jgi:hypothetical protein
MSDFKQNALSVISGLLMGIGIGTILLYLYTFFKYANACRM